MKILVTIKRVTDYEAKLKIALSQNDVVRDNVNMIINPFDEIALEAALRIKDQDNSEVIVVSIGSKDVENQLRSAMAMGADRAILVEKDISVEQNMDASLVAKTLVKIIEKEKPDLVLMGKQAIDDDNHQIPQMVAELFGVAQATQANTITIKDKEAIVIREADGGLETLSIDLPCVITADLRLNEPRYASLPGIMKAKKKPLDLIAWDSLGIKHDNQIKMIKLTMPKSRSQGQRVDSVVELVSKLKTEARVI